MFFDPAPTVKRVIFIATPHHGSYQATGIVLDLIRRIVTLPGTLVSQFQDLLKEQQFAQLGMSQLPTSVDNMSPGNPFIRALNALHPSTRIFRRIPLSPCSAMARSPAKPTAWSLTRALTSKAWNQKKSSAPVTRLKGIRRRSRKFGAY